MPRQGEPDEADRGWVVAVGLQAVEHRAPLRDRLGGDLGVQPGDRGRRCAPGHVGGHGVDAGRELRGARSPAVAGGVQCGHGESVAAGVAAGAREDGGVGGVLPAAMGEQHQRACVPAALGR